MQVKTTIINQNIPSQGSTTRGFTRIIIINKEASAKQKSTEKVSIRAKFRYIVDSRNTYK
jgi:hypothetical protein